MTDTNNFMNECQSMGKCGLSCAYAISPITIMHRCYLFMRFDVLLFAERIMKIDNINCKLVASGSKLLTYFI
jgi:hypothetical protein